MSERTNSRRIHHVESELLQLEADLHTSHGADLSDPHFAVDAAVTSVSKDEEVFDWLNTVDRTQQKADEEMDLFIHYLRNQTTETAVYLSDETYEHLFDVLQAGEYSDETAFLVTQALNKWDDYIRHNDDPGDHNKMMEILLDMPEERLRRVYAAKSDDGSQNPLHELFEKEEMKTAEARLAYTILLEKCLGPKALVDRETTNPHLQALLEKYDHPARALLETIPDMPQSTEQYNSFANDVYKKARILLRSAGYPPEMVSQFMPAAAIRNRNKKGALTAPSYKKELKAMIDQSLRIGANNIKKLYATVGMENIWNYSDYDVDTLLLLIDKDPSEIKRLRDGDVTVLMTDIRGDYNGAMTHQEAIDGYAKPSGRTLRFELTKASDVYRHMIFLNRLNIYPSTLVFAAHGAPGVTGIGAGSERIEFVVSDGKFGAQKNKQIQIDKTSIGRLKNEYMQPNRGIDSSDDVKNQKVIVLYTCSGDAQVEMGQGKYSSVAEEVSSAIGQGSIVYAGEKSLFVTAGDDGVKFLDHGLYHKTGRTLRRSVMNELHSVDAVTEDGKPTQRVIRLPIESVVLNRPEKRSA